MGSEVCDAVLNILNKEGMISSLISTFIALIPKKVNSDSITNFWPISLCNVLYKFISKTITNRLKPLMHSNQSAFILDKLITDNIMVAHELLHSLKEKKNGRIWKMAVKLDISKVYDRVK